MNSISSDSFTQSHYFFIFAENDLAKLYDKKQFKPIKAVYKHPGYGLDTKFQIINDVGLIELAEPLTFSESVQPACLGFDPTVLYEGDMKVSGWGTCL